MGKFVFRDHLFLGLPMEFYNCYLSSLHLLSESGITCKCIKEVGAEENKI